MAVTRDQIVEDLDTEIEQIPVRQLSVVWVNAQRPYNEKWAKEIADNFDPDKFDPLIVTKPNGDMVYHIIEGQHRRNALEIYATKTAKAGEVPENQCAPCRIIADADPARAAEIWLGINGGRKSVSPIHGFMVAVVAGREPEVTINNIVIANHYMVAQNKTTVNTIAAVGALRTIYNRHGRMTLSNVLKVLRYLWKGDPAAVTTWLLRGFAIFVNEFGTHIDHNRMVKAFGEKWSPHKLTQAAKVRREGTTEKLDEAIAELILREYNKGLKDTQKLRHKG